MYARLWKFSLSVEKLAYPFKYESDHHILIPIDDIGVYNR